MWEHATGARQSNSKLMKIAISPSKPMYVYQCKHGRSLCLHSLSSLSEHILPTTEQTKAPRSIYLGLLNETGSFRV